MSKLWQARFFTTVNQLRDLPDTQAPEIAFAGRSNVGKSSLINAVTGRKSILTYLLKPVLKARSDALTER